jgi:hypothetical protein
MTPGTDIPMTPGTGIPKTGDTAPLGLYMMAMCLSGLVLMILGLGSRRSAGHEKDR